jgi:hypothetical protein
MIWIVLNLSCKEKTMEKVKADLLKCRNVFIAQGEECGFLKSYLPVVVESGIYKKIVVTASNFRTSKTIFECLEKCIDGAVINRGVDELTITKNGVSIHFVPIGNGERVRSLRCNCLIVARVDEIRRDVLETVLASMAAISQGNSQAVMSGEKALEVNGKQSIYSKFVEVAKYAQDSHIVV